MDDPRQSVEFERVALGRRRRRIDPAVIGVVLVAVGLTVAVVKPWGGDPSGPPSDVALATRSSDPVASGPPSGNDRPIPAVVLAAAPTLEWDDVASVIRSHAEWGIRAILRSPSRSTIGAGAGYEERWAAVRERPDGSSRAILQVGDRSLVGLGVSHPTGQTPLDVRIWRRSSTGTLYWLDARPIARLPAQGGLIFVPSPSDPGLPAWAPGEYRIDLLLGDGVIRSVEIAIPDRYENVSPSSIDPQAVSEIVATSQADPSRVAVGPFATIDHIAYPLDGVGGPPLDEPGAWLDTEPGSGRVPADRVAVATLPRATGLGVRLPDGSRVRAASFQRLSPGPLRSPPAPVGGEIIDRPGEDPWVVFAARRGDAWAPGVYRIDVTWSDQDGLHDGSWHVELRPGPYTGPPQLLAMTRAWARHAGRSGIVVGRAEPLEGGPRSSAIRLLRTADQGTTGDQDGSVVLCGGTIVDGTPEAFGLVYPADDALRVRRVRMDGPEPSGWELPTVQATDVVLGLTLVAPTDGASFRPGIYRVAVEDRAGERTITLCVGGAGAGGE